MNYLINDPTSTTEDTRLPAWHPMVGYIIKANRMFGNEFYAGFGRPGERLTVVDGGVDSVWDMATALYERDEQVDFLNRLEIALKAADPNARTEVAPYGDSPGGMPYIGFESDTMAGYILLSFAEREDSDYNKPVTSGGLSWMENDGHGYDFVNTTYMTIQWAVAAILAMRDVHPA